MTAVAADVDRARVLADKFIEFLETGHVPEGLLAPDTFLDISLPTWREQAHGAEDAVAIRRAGHPQQGKVPRHRLDVIPSGFVLEWEETWLDGGQQWYCREMCRADVSAEGITSMSVYCTGDWDEARIAEHAAAVRLLQP